MLFANLMVDYFNYMREKQVANVLDTVNGKQQYDQVDAQINEFCTANNLQVKALKEVHYLCI